MIHSHSISSTKTRIKTLAEDYDISLFVPPHSISSTKTRIKTGSSLLRCIYPCLCLTAYHPLKQGLRLKDIIPSFIFFISLTAYHPLKQGLRLLLNDLITQRGGTHSISSTKTRIKTGFVYLILMILMLSHSISSTKTRIKTPPFHSICIIIIFSQHIIH